MAAIPGESESRRLVHELEVHQIELEMQNAELRLARNDMEALLEKYTELYDFAPVGYFTLAADGRILLANLTGSTLVGMERSNLVGRSFGMLVAVESRAAFKSFLKQVFEGDSKQSAEFRLLETHGPPRFVRLEAHRSLDGLGCRVLVVDITERKAAEEVLRRSEVLFHALIQKAPIGVYVVDAGFRLQQANPVAMTVFANVDPLIGRDFSEVMRLIWSARVANQIIGHFRHTLETGESYESPGFIERRRDTGLKEVYEWQIQRVTLPAGEFGVFCFFNNITERTRAETAQLRLGVLSAFNLKLKQEIVRRQVVEEELRANRNELSHALRQSRLHQRQLRDLSHRLFWVQEDERKRISRELHDVIAQTLVGINVHLGVLAHRAATEPDSLIREISLTQKLMEQAVDVVHDFARELRPTVLDDLGLVSALQSHMKDFMATTGIRVSLKVFKGIDQLTDKVPTTLFRIVQEALANVARHAKASHVSVCIESFDGILRMSIADDGQGFAVGAKQGAKKNRRLGLIGMRERVEMLGGSFHVDSRPGGPTTVWVEIPLRGKA